MSLRDLVKPVLLRCPQAFYDSTLVEEAQDNNRDHRSQKKIHQHDNQCRNQSKMQREVPHRGRVQNAFQDGQANHSCKNDTDYTGVSHIVKPLIDHHTAKLAVRHANALHGSKFMAAGDNVGNHHIGKVD